MRTATDKAAALRERILGVATRSIGREGFHGASMRKIAAELGITAPTLYYYFESKQELVWAIVSRGLEQFNATCSSALQGSDSPPQQIRAHVIAHVQHNYRHPDLVQMFDLLFTAVNHAPSDIRSSIDTMARTVLPEDNAQLFSTAVSDILRQLGQVIQRGMEAGEFSVDNLELATAATLTIPDRTIRWIQPTALFNVDDIAANQAQLVLRMLGYNGA